MIALGGETISINVMLDDLRTYEKFFVHGGEVISITFVRGGNRTDEKSAPIIKAVFYYGGGNRTDEKSAPVINYNYFIMWADFPSVRFLPPPRRKKWGRTYFGTPAASYANSMQMKL